MLYFVGNIRIGNAIIASLNQTLVTIATKKPDESGTENFYNAIYNGAVQFASEPRVKRQQIHFDIDKFSSVLEIMSNINADAQISAKVRLSISTIRLLLFVTKLPTFTMNGTINIYATTTDSATWNGKQETLYKDLNRMWTWLTTSVISNYVGSADLDQFWDEDQNTIPIPSSNVFFSISVKVDHKEYFFESRNKRDYMLSMIETGTF